MLDTNRLAERDASQVKCHSKPWPLQSLQMPCRGGPAGVFIMSCLARCCAQPLLGLFDALHLLSFVQGVAWYGTKAAERQVA